MIPSMNTQFATRVVVQSVKTHRDARGSLFEPLTDAERKRVAEAPGMNFSF